ncbi:macrolide transporter subunit MacA [Pandoraea pulmonicola]|uniref:Efflux transporter periplasmic adaptor subunit n=1 Tax=Pandoraea pulmonicola TaxID=93221 RepID=A0AAJ5D1V1_PANPU|nr:macrolide transporter subunit MacA [Pandoraea pulmonicola]AJC19704.1 efflux transporter periplasmic adaptor subunit [Pandoraea pulmonicola]SUA92166.1 Macrolide-specific efflux protein macA precursor [Pandoraea pulmonicola]
MTLFPPFRLTRRRKIGVAVFVLLCGVAFWLWPRPKPPAYLSAKVTRADLEDAVLATGVLQPIKQVEVGSQANGQLRSLKVVLGDRVTKGQLLAEIDPTSSDNDLREATAGLTTLAADRRAKSLRRAQAEREFARQRQLAHDDATSPRELEKARTESDALAAEVESLDSQIRQQNVKVDKARTNLSYTRITAPINGTVTAITTQEGQTVTAIYQIPTILKIADLSQMTIRAQVSEADVVRIREGQRVYFTILGAPETRYEGKLRVIQPSPEKINNAIFFNALFDVPNPDGVLRPDMTAQVSIVRARIEKALTFPSVALGEKRADGRYRVRVLDAKGNAHVRWVKVGLDNRLTAQALDGLSEGEHVVTADPTDAPPPGATPDSGGVL